jgi:hypothetical protein
VEKYSSSTTFGNFLSLYVLHAVDAEGPAMYVLGGFEGFYKGDDNDGFDVSIHAAGKI